VGRHANLADLAPLEELAAHGTPVVADLGCGDGRTVRAVLERLDRAGAGAGAGAGGGAAPVVVHALDQVSALPEDLLADRRVRSRITDLDGVLPLEGASVDVAFSLNVLEHLLDPLAHLGEVHRVLRPGGLLVLAHSDWDTALFTSPDDALTRVLVDRFVATAPGRVRHRRSEVAVDGFMGRKLLTHAAASGALGAPWSVLEVTSWADPHRRFDEDSVAWKVATGVLAATRDDPQLSARAAGWLEALRRAAAAGHFLFTVTDVALVLRRHP
jgi:SAM-dependent methyltransferase